MHDELNVIPLLNELTEITCALPKLTANDTIKFIKWTYNTKLKPNKYGILEPESSEVVVPSLIIIPHLACDKSGNRLGYGKGYYDKYLANATKEPYVIALCYEKLISDVSLPCTEEDKKVDMIITEETTHIIQPL